MSTEEAWIDTLRREAQATSQSKTAARIGYSPAVVNQVLKGTYKGDLSRVQAAVEGALMGGQVACPVLGELPKHHCLETQRLPFAATNPQRVRLFRACRQCPNNRTGK